MADLSSPPASGAGVGKIDSAETFAESGVSLTHTDTEVSGESVQLGTVATGDTASPFGSYSTTYTGESLLGYIVNPNEEIQGFQVTIDGSISVTDVVLEQTDGTELDRVSASSGETVEVSATLAASTEYRLYVTGSGSGDADGAPGYPISTTSFDVVTGFCSSSFTRDSAAWDVIESIESIDDAGSGTVYVSWASMPTDLSDWDRALYTASKDGETVSVYVEEDQSGWTEVAGPVQSGDPIPAAASNDVRFRVEFSRQNTSNNPTLDSIYRRWILG